MVLNLTNQHNCRLHASEEETVQNIVKGVQQVKNYQTESLDLLTSVKEESLEFKDEAVACTVRDIVRLVGQKNALLETTYQLYNKSVHELNISINQVVDMLIERLVSLHQDVLRHTKASSVDLDCLINVNKSSQLSVREMQACLDTLMSTFKSHSDLIDTNAAQVGELAGSIEANCNQLYQAVLQEKNCQTQQKRLALADLQVDSDQKLKKIRSVISDCEAVSGAKDKARETFTMAQAELLKNNSAALNKVKEGSKTFLDDLAVSQKDAYAKYKAKQIAVNGELRENKENIDKQIGLGQKMSEEKLRGNMKHADNLEQNAHDIKMNMTQILNGLQEATQRFVSEEIKKNVVTGGTPTPKERTYPRTLQATSPHQKIVKR